MNEAERTPRVAETAFERALEHEIDPVPRSLELAVQSATAAQRKRASARCASAAVAHGAPRGSRRGFVIAAAVACYALVTLFLIVADGGGQRFASPQDPQNPQARTRALEFVQPATTDELDALLAHVRAVRVRNVVVNGGGGGFDDYIDMSGVGASTSAVELAEADRLRLVAEIAQDGLVAGESLAAWAVVKFELDGKRVMHAHYDFHSKNSLYFAGLGASRVSAELCAVLADAVRRSEEMAIRANGIISGREALRVLPPDIDRVVALRIDGSDLDLLARRERLVHLDIAAARGRTAADVFRGLTKRPELRSLVIHPRHLEQLDTGKLLGLRSLSLDPARSGMPFTGNNCVVCHRVDNARPQHLAEPLTPLKRLRTLQHLGLRAAVVPAQFPAVIGELPLLRSLDLSGCDVAALPPKALSRIPALRRLALAGARGLTREWLTTLVGMTYLEELDLRAAALLTDADVAAIRQALPRCRVRR